jgi:hypothetical protein
VNADNIRAEIERLKKNIEGRSDSGIVLAVKHQIEKLERKLKEKGENIMGGSGTIPPPRIIQTAGASVTLKDFNIKRNWIEVPIVWPKPFPDATYKAHFSFAHLSVGTVGQSRFFTNNGWRDKTPKGFLAVIGITGGVVGDPLEIDATGIENQ